MSSCIFCTKQNPLTFDKILYTSQNWFVVYDNMPVSPGHVLFITKEHYAEWFAVPPEVQLELVPLLQEVKEKLQTEFGATGFNFGFNSGPDAGQTIFHVHLHLIPRYPGDMDDPRGGIRGVIPQKQKYFDEPPTES